MKSFGRLLRRLRGQTPLSTVAADASLDPGYLAQVEGGQINIDETRARHVLQRGFHLDVPDTERLVLGVQLYDLGLTDNELRQLVIGLICRELPPVARTELKQLYRRYTSA